MAEWQDSTRADYRRKGFATRTGYGEKPALLVIDFINGFTDPATPLDGDFPAEIAVTRRLPGAFRTVGLPVIYTVIACERDLRDGGMWMRKVPSLAILRKGAAMVAVDDRIRPREYMLEKNANTCWKRKWRAPSSVPRSMPVSPGSASTRW